MGLCLLLLRLFCFLNKVKIRFFGSFVKVVQMFFVVKVPFVPQVLKLLKLLKLFNTLTPRFSQKKQKHYQLRTKSIPSPSEAAV